MKKIFLIFLLFGSLLNADMWSKMFKKVDTNNPTEMNQYGFQVGYNDGMNGVTRYAPSRDPFVRGYYEGRRAAHQDKMIQSYQEDENFQDNPIIVIYQ